MSIVNRQKRYANLATFTLIIAAFSAAFIFGKDILASRTIDAKHAHRHLNDQLLNLPPNKWVKIRSDNNLGWYRQAHAGITFDSKRGTLLLFGSNTHGMNWDNTVHEFNPVTAKWTTHYPEAAKETYRSDSGGNAICGNGTILPWAMHTFDNIEYDPYLDAIVVTALPAHNYVKKSVASAKSAKIHPTWFYLLSTHSWQPFNKKSDKKAPPFFAAASAYDEDRNVVIAYNYGGVWELGRDRSEWRKATSESHHQIHFNMVYNPIYHIFAVFGDHRDTNDVWIYTPGANAGDKGKWKKRIPKGDFCPRDQHFPVAVDGTTGLFLIVPDNTVCTEEKGRQKCMGATSASTFIFDYENNVYRKIPGADMPSQKMNYMMVYDSFHEVFLLVTGDAKEPLTVWAFKLKMAEL